MRVKIVLFYASWCASAVVLFAGSLWTWLVWRRGCVDSLRRLSSEEIDERTARAFTHRIVDLVTPTLCVVMVVSSAITLLIFSHVLAISLNEYYLHNVTVRLRWLVSGARTLVASLTVATGTIGPIPSIVQSALDSTCGLESTIPSVMISAGSALLQLGCYIEPCLWEDPLPTKTTDTIGILAGGTEL